MCARCVGCAECVRVCQVCGVCRMCWVFEGVWGGQRRVCGVYGMCCARCVGLLCRVYGVCWVCGCVGGWTKDDLGMLDMS